MSTIQLNEPIARAIARVLGVHVVGVPAVDSFHRLLSDIVTSALDEIEAPADAEIHNVIAKCIAAEPDVDHALIAFTVCHGKVTFRGAITDERHRQKLLAITAGVPSVASVNDQLVWYDAATGAFRPPHDGFRVH